MWFPDPTCNVISIFESRIGTWMACRRAGHSEHLMLRALLAHTCRKVCGKPSCLHGANARHDHVTKLPRRWFRGSRLLCSLGCLSDWLGWPCPPWASDRKLLPVEDVPPVSAVIHCRFAAEAWSLTRLRADGEKPSRDAGILGFRPVQTLNPPPSQSRQPRGVNAPSSRLVASRRPPECLLSPSRDRQSSNVKLSIVNGPRPRRSRPPIGSGPPVSTVHCPGGFSDAVTLLLPTRLNADQSHTALLTRWASNSGVLN